ncbi:UNVERIFIED_CONTAM: hypothetical protein K2H54_046926 [Gekko kuhli]
MKYDFRAMEDMEEMCTDVGSKSITFCTGMVRAADQESCQSGRTPSDYPLRGLEAVEVPSKTQECGHPRFQICIASLHEIRCSFL